MAIDYSKFKGTYTADSIGVESGLKAVAKQAGMYLGSKGPNGLIYQFSEILDNSVDELLHLISKRDKNDKDNLVIEIEFYEDASIRIRDCGRGIPVGINKKTGVPTIESVFESTSSGGKSYSVENQGYGQITRGTHGAGSAVVAATCAFMNIKVTTIEDDCTYTLKYGYQEKLQPITKIGTMQETGFGYGTEVHFKYDENIFVAVRETNKYPFVMSEIENMLANYCYPCEGLTFKLKYKLPGKEAVSKEFNSNDYDLQQVISQSTKGTMMDQTLELKGGEYSLRMICASRGNKSAKYIYANGLTMDRSTHATLFPIIVQDAIKELLIKAKIYNRDYPMQFNAATSLNYALILEARNPEYTAQHKNEYEDAIFEKLLKANLKPFLFKNGGNFIRELFAQERQNYVKMVERLEAKKKQTKDVKKVISITKQEAMYMERLTAPLAPYHMSDLIIVEGPSASNELKSLLNPNQGLTFLRGMFPNAYSMDEDKLAASTHFLPIKQAFSLNWNRIIILSDPDPIGGFIQCLLLATISKYYPHLIQMGKIYLLSAPLYVAYSNGKATYIYSDKEKEEYIKTRPNDSAIEKNKGIGSMTHKDKRYLLDYNVPGNLSKIEQLDPKSLSEGMRILNTLFGKNAAYRKDYVLGLYGTPTIRDYYAKKKNKKIAQRIGFDFETDIPNMSKELGYTGNLISEDEYTTLTDALEANIW